MGTLFTILAGLYVIAKLFSAIQGKAKESVSKDTGSFLDTLEKKIIEFEQKAVQEEIEDTAGESASPKPEKHEKRMKSHSHPEYEGTLQASTLMPTMRNEEDDLKIRILEETEKAPPTPFLPEERRERTELLKKGIILKEIFERKYF